METKMKTGKYDENRLLHLLLDMGEMLLASGAEINRVEDTLPAKFLTRRTCRAGDFLFGEAPNPYIM